MKKLEFGKSQLFYQDAKKIIPGGTQLLSKRPELYLPNLWPSYYKKANGLFVWDLDNRKYKDFSTNGIGACPLGYANKYVDSSVVKGIKDGSMSSLNSYEEVHLAELLISLHPWAKMVRFARTGGEACSIGVRIARAYTEKDVILFCGYHGWHDWYLSANIDDPKNLNKQLLEGLQPKGVPSNLINSTSPFIFNDEDSLEEAFKKYSGKVAAVIMEPIRGVKPTKKFITKLRSLLKQNDSLLIIDEVTSGFRENLGGYHLELGIKPDISILGKGLGNGYPISAIIGTKKVMQAAEDTFISSTFFSERLGFIAALNTIRFMKENSVQDSLKRSGKIIKQIWMDSSLENNLEISISGLDPLATFSFTENNHGEPIKLMTLYIQEMLRRGYLAGPAVYATIAHTENELELFKNNVSSVFKFISKVIDDDKVDQSLLTEPKHTGFQRLN